ncbi:hypothetical protein A2333_00905 [Candidatus Wolfebacteria bacterium RIFOXYB2_FULL_49_7]|uniref:Cell division protein FtsL n=1 Tax=Candidatus Wolfebacteria bacterium RIFOXYB1_FULL_54_12 TaxID=1802559 RepID=A0A1F8DW83_9BACT|nr:MAG: hypothetical protein A2372_00670 [Candidatus Wolfebacteria bacterium RIFOXYB1_FULL_54_12]OGM94156.1 MAG: hypothetical protein A2333_00905 [Candidatus Wolfebacteria bacterium RIFOXYB2_FULL_49_7]
MTIIRQKKEYNPIKRLLVGLTVGAACAAIGGIIFYNQVVNNSHEITQRRGGLRDMEVRNAELKSELYALTDTQKMQEFAANNGLVIEKNPKYVRRQGLSINVH